MGRRIYLFHAGIILIMSCVNFGWSAGLYSGEQPSGDSQADSLAKLLPEKLVTIVDKTLDDQFADIERLVSQLPNMDKKKAFLITLLMENFIEDIYFPANRPAVIYPRMIFLVIHKELKNGKSKKEIARVLVALERQNEYEKMHKMTNKGNPKQ